MASYKKLQKQLDKLAKKVKKGPKSVKSSMIDLAIDELEKLSDKIGELTEEPLDTGKKDAKKSKKKSKKSSKSASKSEETLEEVSPTLDSDASPTRDVAGLAEFMAAQKPGRSNRKFNALAVYYLKEIEGQATVTDYDVQGCYLDAGRSMPVKFAEGLKATQDENGWLVIHEDGTIDLTEEGRAEVED